MSKVATVCVFRGLELSYSVPKNLEVSVGSLVRVPVRYGVSEGVVTRIFEESEFLEQKKFSDGKELFELAETTSLKPIYGLVQKEPAITPTLVSLAEWMRDYYGCGLQSAMEAMIPSVVRDGGKALFATVVGISKHLSKEECEKLSKKAPKQFELYSTMLSQKSEMFKSALLKLSGATAAAYNGLVRRGIFCEEKRKIARSAFDDELSKVELVSPEDLPLNDEQKAAFEDILEDVKSETFKTRLLYGVTGSGKTEIYIRAMKEVLSRGGGCIFLVPEIALTPQTVGRLKSKLGGGGLVVWHSNLSDGQRLDAWRALAQGEANVVVGARSCVFAPLKNLKLIIVDEEHDTAYKQDSNPRYNGRDIAVMRAKLEGCACVLGSATPSLESLQNAKTGKYGLSRIRSRVDSRKLPKVFVIDMKREKGGSQLSQILVSKMAERLENREQTILFLNRRGYSKFYQCPDCGEVAECPHCSVGMTWHRREGVVKCHLCGYSCAAPDRCPKCGSQNAKWKSHGTERVEETVAKIFPSARVGRMDADTMRKRHDYRRVLGEFKSGKLDILVGTQMIAKGLDFPRVTLVGIINADISLHMPDFRSAERTYQLIVQVAGRAGRGDGDGEVIVQTMTPEASPIQYAKSDDMEEFLEEELAARTEFGYPPTKKLIRHIFRSRSPEKLEFCLDKWVKSAEPELEKICEIRGPAPAPRQNSEDN